MTRQELHKVAQRIHSPEEVSMTLAEFLKNDIDRYEYVKGELVPMSPAPRIHSKMRDVHKQREHNPYNEHEPIKLSH